MAKGGRPPKWESPERLEEAVKRYFEDCKGELLRDEYDRPILVKGKPVYVRVKPPTVTGLARALGFSSRQSLLNYQGKKAFEDIITVAKLRIEEYAEECLYDRDTARGAEFNLRMNFKWRDPEREKENPENEGGVVILTEPETPEEKGGTSGK